MKTLSKFLEEKGYKVDDFESEKPIPFRWLLEFAEQNKL